MKKLLSFAAGLALVAGSSTVAQAQSCSTAGCTVTHTVSATAPTVLNLTLSTTTTALTNPTTAASFDSTAGIDNAGPVVTVTSNKNASVTISTAAANWTGPVGTTKAISDLGWRTTGSGHGAGLSSTAADVIASGKGVRTATITWNTFWRLASDEPGAYSLATTFTLVAP